MTSTDRAALPSRHGSPPADGGVSFGAPVNWAGLGHLMPVAAVGGPGQAARVALGLAEHLDARGYRTLLLDAACPGESVLARTVEGWSPPGHGGPGVVHARRGGLRLARVAGPTSTAAIPPGPDAWIAPGDRQQGWRPEVTVVALGSDAAALAADPRSGAAFWLRSGQPAPSPLLVAEADKHALAESEHTLEGLAPYVADGSVAGVSRLVLTGAERRPRKLARTAGQRVATLLDEAVLLPDAATDSPVGTGPVPAAVRDSLAPLTAGWAPPEHPRTSPAAAAELRDAPGPSEARDVTSSSDEPAAGEAPAPMEGPSEVRGDVDGRSPPPPSGDARIDPTAAGSAASVWLYRLLGDEAYRALQTRRGRKRGAARAGDAGTAGPLDTSSAEVGQTPDSAGPPPWGVGWAPVEPTGRRWGRWLRRGALGVVVLVGAGVILQTVVRDVHHALGTDQPQHTTAAATVPATRLSGFAEQVGTDYLSWSAGSKPARGQALGRYSAPGSDIDGWDGSGRQAVTAAHTLGITRARRGTAAVVTVAVRITPYQATGKAPAGASTGKTSGPRVPGAAPGPDPATKGYKAQPARWLDLAVPVAQKDDRLVVTATPDLVGSVPAAAPSPAVGSATSEVDQAGTDATRPVVARLMSDYAASNLAYSAAAGARFSGLGGAASPGEIQAWQLAPVAPGQDPARRSGDLTIAWHLAGGGTLTCHYRITLAHQNGKTLLAAVSPERKDTSSS
jgi:hypothetical protein